MKILGAIIAGGKSLRMGGQEKALLLLGGKPLLQHAIDCLKPQVDTLIVNANGDATRFSAFGLPVLPDLLTDIGTPLAGLHTVLHYAKSQGFDAVLTVPSDCPFLPQDLCERLKVNLPAIAASAGQGHYLTGLWPVRLVPVLDRALADGMRSLRDFARLAKAHEVEWPVAPLDPFANLNTPEEFASAEALLAR